MLSAQPWAHSTWLPHDRGGAADWLYWLLDPLALYLFSGWLTFLIVYWPTDVPVKSWRMHGAAIRLAALRALCWLLIATAGLWVVERSFKTAMSRARPVAQAEHPIIAAHLEGWLPSSIVDEIRSSGYHFECPLGDAAFSGDVPLDRSRAIAFFAASTPLSHTDIDRHLDALHQRRGISTMQRTFQEQQALMIEMGKWRRAHIVPVLAAVLPLGIGGHDIDDISGSLPSGHVLRQTFGLLVFLYVALEQVGPHLFRWGPYWLSVLGLQLFSMVVCVWSRVYGYDHSWSDEMVSLSLTVGLLAFAILSQRTILRYRRGITQALFDATALDLMRNVRLIVIAYDRKGRMLLWNREAEMVTGYKAEEVPDLKSYAERVYKQNPRLALQRLRELMAMTDREHPRNIVTTISTKKGEKKVIVWNGVQIPDDRHAISGKLSIGHEINRLDRRLADLGSAVTAVVHEMKHAVRLLRRNYVGRDDEVSRDIDRLAAICDGYTNYVKGDQGAVYHLNPRHLIDFAVDIVGDDAEERQVEVDRRYPNEDIWVVGNEYLIRHSLIDLLRNAVEASADARVGKDDRPFVVIGAERLQRDGADLVQFFVSDAGPGLPRAMQSWMEEGPFYGYMSEGSQESERGLGILLANIAAREHGGWISSEVINGKHTIALCLPAAVVPSRSARMETAS
jgi:PAS domain S-box-containing protein